MTGVQTCALPISKGLIDEEEYRSHKQKLQEERMMLHRETQEVELRADRARAALENLLEFMTHVQEWMKFGEVVMKRACVSALGSNFLLDGKKLLLEPHPLLKLN